MRAYQDDLVEVEDVVEAQIMESLTIAQHEMIRYEHVTSRARLEFVIGTEIERRWPLTDEATKDEELVVLAQDRDRTRNGSSRSIPTPVRERRSPSCCRLSIAVEAAGIHLPQAPVPSGYGEAAT